jgi:hypothetical protein
VLADVLRLLAINSDADDQEVEASAQEGNLWVGYNDAKPRTSTKNNSDNNDNNNNTQASLRKAALAAIRAELMRDGYLQRLATLAVADRHLDEDGGDAGGAGGGAAAMLARGGTLLLLLSMCLTCGVHQRRRYRSMGRHDGALVAGVATHLYRKRWRRFGAAHDVCCAMARRCTMLWT